MLSNLRRIVRLVDGVEEHLLDVVVADLVGRLFGRDQDGPGLQADRRRLASHQVGQVPKQRLQVFGQTRLVGPKLVEQSGDDDVAESRKSRGTMKLIGRRWDNFFVDVGPRLSLQLHSSKKTSL